MCNMGFYSRLVTFAFDMCNMGSKAPIICFKSLRMGYFDVTTTINLAN